MLMVLPIIVPSIVYAVGLYRYYAELRLLGSYVGVIAAHAVLGLPYVMIAVSASLANSTGALSRQREISEPARVRPSCG